MCRPASTVQQILDELHPVHDGHRRAALQMRDAADVRRYDHLRLGLLQLRELALAQLVRERRLRERIGARGAAAQMAVGGQPNFDAEPLQQPLDLAAQLLAVLQRARRMIGDGMDSAPARERDQLGLEAAEQLGCVLRQLDDAARLVRVGRIAAQQVRVLAHRRAAAGRVHHDRFDAALDVRPPRVDVASRIVERFIVIAQMQPDRAAAAGFRRDHGFDAERIQHARGRDVDVRHHRRLHAAREHQHAALAPRARPREQARARRHLVAQPLRQQRPHVLAEPHHGREHGRVRHEAREQAPHDPLRQRPRHLRLDDLAADVDEPAVLDARRAGRLATAAREAAVEVLLRAARDFRALEHLLDQVDASARAVELVAEQLVGRAGRGAEAAVHAPAQDRVGVVAVGRVADEIGEVRLHRALEIGVEPAAVEDARRIERRLQAAVDFHQRRGQRREHARAPVVAFARAKERRVAARLFRAHAHRLRVGVGDPPALRAAPFHHLRAGQVHRLGDRRQRQPPQRMARRERREERVVLLAHAFPEALGLDRVDGFAAEHGLRALHGRLRARQAQHERAVAPRARGQRKRAARPFVELAHRVGRAHVELQRELGGGDGQHLDRQLEHQPERAERARHQPRHVVARDVLHDLPAEAQPVAAPVQDRHAEHEIARRARRRAARAGEARRHRAAERRDAPEMRRLERQHLAALGERRLELGERRARARGDDELGRVVRHDAVMRARIEDFPVERLAVPVLRAAAAYAQRAAARRGVADARGPACDDVVLFHGVVFRCSFRSILPGRRDRTVGPNPYDPLGARARRQKRGRSGCGSSPPRTCIRPYSAQRARVGMPLSGFSSSGGSNARLIAKNASHSSRENCTHIEFSFSTPTPCSPVTVPPNSTQVSRMSAPNASARCSSSTSFALNRMSGCMLPSPAWNTLMQRSPYFVSICSMRARSGPIARRGTVPSMQ
ncbi:hypothetical protein BURPS1710b_3344 [Burkholderia pseudomallei 1710b]|uniref:Uncharacterized protein n=1 Tax=Burkholderia pseudomallei (strain 1710b) TaxID=320372 RepID=Q3JNY9_BURP1|nr:hypothetical protein BURPS1710b_3344 [Burkholderia pseudomallei 1710b]